MKTLNNYINEALIKKDTKIKIYNYHPKDGNELKSIIKELLKERGKDADLNDIDTSAITNMSYLFPSLDPYNIDISEWDVSNVTNMEEMFYYCLNFNSDLSRWDVSNVENMRHMFWKATSFNCDLSGWNVKNVKSMTNMFYGCDSLPYSKEPTWYKK